MATGSVKRTKANTWRAVVDLPAAPGEPRLQKSKTFRLKADAEAWKNTMLGNPPHRIDSDIRLSDYLVKHWLPFYATQYKPSSHLLRDSLCRLHVIPALGNYKLSKLSPTIIQGFLVDLKARGVGPTAIQHASRTLCAALNQAMKWELIDRNPCQNIKKPTATKREPTIWTPEQLQTFLAAEEDDQWRVLWTMLAVTGMRIGEVLALSWDDVDLVEGVLYVRKTRTRGSDGKWTEGPAKTRGSERRVVIPAALRVMLGEHHAQSGSFGDDRKIDSIGFKDAPTVERSANTINNNAPPSNGRRRVIANPDKPIREGSSASGSTHFPNLLFIGQLGPICHHHVLSRFKSISRRTSLPVIRIHDLRHTNVTIGLRAGIPLKVLSERLGHANIGITANIYAHVTRDMDRDAADLIERTLLGHDSISQ